MIALNALIYVVGNLVEASWTSFKNLEPDIVKMGQFLAPETDRNAQFLAPEIINMGQKNFLSQKLTKWLCFWGQKQSKNVSFWAQKSSKCVSKISGARN